jgi:FlaA1/EpsC-like NDP-sugar epimerase
MEPSNLEISRGAPAAGRYRPAKPVMSASVRLRYLLLIDLAFIWLAIIFAFAVRYEALINVYPYLRLGWTYFLLVPLVRLPVYYVSRLYYRLWRYASMKELLIIATASAVSSALIFIINFGLLPLLGITHMRSGSVWLIEGVLSFGFLGGTRFMLRLLQERYRPQDLARFSAFQRNPTRVLIAGAGDAGAMMVREIQNNAALGYTIVGLVDDDPAKRRYSLNGLPVLGNRGDIPQIIAKHGVDHVIIAMPTASGRDLRDIVRICEEAGITPQTIPGIYEMIDGRVTLNQVRNVEIEDLLRREPVQTDFGAVRELLANKRVLVTGGGGSIGSELCRQILRCHPAELILIGHGENSIFEIQNELLREVKRHARAESAPRTPTKVLALIADIRFEDRILRLFRQHRPEVVFHAAAHKHVPLMEENPAEAITNNVLGTRNVVRAALATNVERFVMISTDKAVNPTSIMGATKRAAELLVHEAALESRRPYVAVRFGNVLGSRGSVVLTFKKQIAAGGPITVTHPDVKRYFMTIPEAVQLVLQSSVLGSGGEVFLLDMGDPIRIVDLARDLIKLSGLEEGRDIDIQFTGMRPGEKLFEELFVSGEEYKRTRHEKIFIASNASSFVPQGLESSIRALHEAAEDNDREAIVRNLLALIPEYTPQALPGAAAGEGILSLPGTPTPALPSGTLPATPLPAAPLVLPN